MGPRHPHSFGHSFGELLRRYRQAAGLTQEALAERARLSVRGLSDLEHGRTRTPRPDTLALLLTALGLSAQERALLVAAARDPGGPALSAAPARSLPAARTSSGLAPVVGRQGDLDLLDRHLAGEGPPLLLLAGDPGIGKTRLLQEVVQRAVAQGLTVLTGSCSRRGGQEPYAPLLDALEQYIRGQDPLALRRDLQGCAWLVRLLPELAEGPIPPLAPQTLTPEQERRLLFGAVRRFLANVAGPAGTLLLLDDLQWAGSDALDLLSFLARSAAAVPLRVVGAYRDTEVEHHDPLAMLRADLAQAGLTAHHALGPLAAEEAAHLLDALLAGVEGPGHAVVARVLQRAGGTPFFLVSFAHALCQGGGEAVPWDVAQGVRQRVALLPAGGREVLAAAAIVGRQVPHALLVAAVGQPEEALLAGLEAACRARLLLEEGDAAYAFAHDVIREVVEADMGAARRALLHRRVAQALEAGPVAAPPELLAYHYAHGGVPEKAVSYLEQAGDHAWAQRAHGAAEGHYRGALDGLEALRRAPDAARVRAKLGEILFRTGQYGAALLLLEGAAEALRAAGDRDGLVRVALLIGRVHGQRGTPDEGVARVQALLEVLDGNDSSPSLATVYALLGHLLQTVSAYHEALAASERAIELARACGDDQTRVLAEWNRACCVAALGREGAARRLIQEVLPLMGAVDDRDMLSWAHHDLAYTYAVQGAFETGQTHIDRALATAEHLGDTGELALTLALRGRLTCLCGRWEQARRDLEQAAEVSGRLDRSWYAAYPLYFLADLRLAQGDRADAARAAGEAIALAEQNTDLQALCWASSVMARCEIADGRPEAASTRLLRLLDRAGVAEDDATGLLLALARARLDQGQVDDAAAIVERTITHARRDTLQIVLVEALWVRCMVMVRKGCWQEAAGNVEEGLTLARGMPYPYAEARLLHLDGERLAAQGEPVGARERLEAALAIFRRLGARTDMERTELALTLLPGTPPGDSSLQPLTALSTRYRVTAVPRRGPTDT